MSSEEPPCPKQGEITGTHTSIQLLRFSFLSHVIPPSLIKEDYGRPLCSFGGWADKKEPRGKGHPSQRSARQLQLNSRLLCVRGATVRIYLAPESPNECVLWWPLLLHRNSRVPHHRTLWVPANISASCVRFSHPSFNPSTVKISKRVNVGEKKRGRGWRNAKPRISAILLQPRIRIILLLEPFSPVALPFAPTFCSRREGEEPLAKAATCRGVEKLQSSLTQRGESGSFLQDLFWTPRQVRRVGAWGPAHAGDSRACGWLRTAVACSRGSWVGLPPPLRLSYSQPPEPPPTGGIHSLPVAKGGGKASAEVPEKPRRCWNWARGSWKCSSASSPFSGPRCRRGPKLLLCRPGRGFPITCTPKTHTHTHTTGLGWCVSC